VSLAAAAYSSRTKKKHLIYNSGFIHLALSLAAAAYSSRERLGCTLQELSVLVKSRSRPTLRKGISDVLRTCAFDEFHGSISNHVSQEMYSYVHVTRAFAICRVLAHEDAIRVIFPDLCTTML
jgi:hypothetical protein